MSELDELRERVAGARVIVKSTQRTLRGLLQYLSDLEERLEAFDGQPQEAHRDEHTQPDRRLDRSSSGAADSARPTGSAVASVSR